MKQQSINRIIIMAMVIASLAIGFFIARPIYNGITHEYPSFPREATGTLTEQPMTTIDDSNVVTISWTVPTDTYTDHYVEFKTESDLSVSANSEYTKSTTADSDLISIKLNSKDSFHQLEPGIYRYQVTSVNYETNETVISTSDTFTIE